MADNLIPPTIPATTADTTCEICGQPGWRWFAGWNGNKPIERPRCMDHGPRITDPTPPKRADYQAGFKDGHAAGFAAGLAAANDRP